MSRPIDITAVRAQFPALRRQVGDLPAVFLDGPSGTQVPQSVIDAMTDYLIRMNANTDGRYPTSRESDAMIGQARRAAGDLLGADPAGVAFGANMTTLNFAITRAFGRTLTPGDRVITTALDHDANVSPWLMVARDRGVEVDTVRLGDDGLLDLDHLRSLITDRTVAVAFTLAANTIGSLTPARAIAQIAHDAGALAWCDSVHFASHRRPDVGAIGADVLLCSPYKYFGPHLGVAWIRPDLAASWPADRVRPADLDPVGHRYEMGTLSHEALAGFIAAVDYIASLGEGGTRAERLADGYAAISSHERSLGERFLTAVASLGHVHVRGVSDPGGLDRRVTTFGLTVDGHDPAAVADAFDAAGIFVGNGNFYGLNTTTALGVEDHGGLVRLGFVHYNTANEVDRAVAVLASLG